MLPACVLCACTLLPGMRAYAPWYCRGVRGLQHPSRPFTAATLLLPGERAGGGEMVRCLGCLCGAGKTVTYRGHSSYWFQRGTAEESQSRGGMRSQATTSPCRASVSTFYAPFHPFAMNYRASP